MFAGLLRTEPEHTYELSLFSWIPAGDFSVDIGFLLDPLSMTMVLFITGIAALIHLYSIGYMHGDSRFPRFFTYLNLFVFSMLMLVLGDNLVLTFLGWEGVGACSYFLIAFWFEKDANASAGKKAFITNRVGDWGFMVGDLRHVLHLRLGEVQRVPAASPPALAADHRDVHRGAALHRCDRQVGPDPAVHLAPRRHGRPHARCRRSSTPPPWSPPACTCSCG